MWMVWASDLVPKTCCSDSGFSGFPAVPPCFAWIVLMLRTLFFSAFIPKTLLVLSSAPHLEGIWWSAWTASWFLNLLLHGSEWTVSRPTCSAPRPGYPLIGSLGGPQRRCGCGGEAKNVFHLSGIEPQFLSRCRPRCKAHWYLLFTY